ncbi:MAG: hypothetical protein IPK87_11080 [Planctomycetes bacterium]|nr:hypothetical protein [Planctomycetota bacterium]
MRPDRTLRVLLATLLLCAAPVTYVILNAQAVIRIRSSGNSSPTGAGQDAQPKVDAVPPIEPTPEEAVRIHDLIEQLGAPRMAQRDRAMGELAQYEARALGQIRKALTHDDDEIAWRCALLDEVIQSRQGELFLAARKLNLSIAELNAHLASDDIGPLLNILKSRGQPGMDTVWARVLGRVAGQPRLFTAAELCRQIEGDTGYGNAVVRCSQQYAGQGNGHNLMMLLVLMPPGEAEDTIEALARIRYAEAANAAMLEQVLSAATAFRGVYAPRQVFAARGGRPMPNVPEPDGAAELRLALALQMSGPCTADELAGAGLPPAEQMTSLVLASWLRLLARSGLQDRLENTLLAMLAGGGNARLAAGAWASAAPVQDVIAVFDSLPIESQLAVLDTWWIEPREPQALHGFLLTLADNPEPALRGAALSSLAQYRAPSTVRKLVASARAHADTALWALLALRPMADLLATADPQGLAALCQDFAATPTALRPTMASILVASADAGADAALLAQWRTRLPRNELGVAMMLFARDTSTPAGAWSAALALREQATGSSSGTWLQDASSQADLVMLRTLLASDHETGFALIAAIASDVADANRTQAMMALSLANRESALVTDWLKRFSGEIPDPQAGQIGWALATSQSEAARQFRRTALQQGPTSPNLGWVLVSMKMKRCPEISLEELYRVVAETPEGARDFSYAWEWAPSSVPAVAARNIVTAHLFGDSQGAIDAVLGLWIRRSGVDVLDVLYGKSSDPVPRDAAQILATALLGDAARAGAILSATQSREDGSNWAALRLSRAWLGLLPGPENGRLVNAARADADSIWGALQLANLADAGDANALRRILDQLGPEPVRFQRGGTAGISFVDRRWGSAQIQYDGVGAALRSDETGGTQLHADLLRHWVAEAPDTWGDWWRCRRGLLHWNGKAFAFTELK